MHPRILFYFTLPFLCSVVWGAATPDAENRTWTRAEDGRTLEAALVSYDAKTDQVTLRLATGKPSTFSAAILIDADRELLRSHATAEAERIARAAVGRWDSFMPEGGGNHRVHIYLPPGYTEGEAANQKRAAAILFSPGGNSRSVMERAKVAADELGWVLIGVDAYRNTKSLEDGYEERMRNTRAAFEAVRARVAFDPKKIVFGGMSGGGWWSFQCAFELTRDAAGIISCGGWMGRMHDKRYSPRMAVAMVNGDKDKSALAWVETDSTFLRAKASAKIKEFSFAGGHVLPSPEVFAEAARWIHKQKQF